MRIHLQVLLGCLVCSISSAEYKELEVLKQSSHETLMKYAEQLSAVDPKFEGIVKFGQALKAIKDESKVDVAKLTYQSTHYWRAVLEMTPADPSVLFAHAHLRASRGETAYADIYFLLGSLTAEKSRRGELDKYRRLKDDLNKRLSQETAKGIKYHDNREYSKALEVYDSIIAEHPNCAEAYYEKGYSYLMMSKADPNMRQKADEMYAECRRLAPLWWKAYQGGGPKVVARLTVCVEKVDPFVSGKQRNKEGFARFAAGCEAMELYPFAAHAQWILALFYPDDLTEHVTKMIELMGKCGCEDVDFFRKQLHVTVEDTPDEAGEQVRRPQR